MTILLNGSVTAPVTPAAGYIGGKRNLAKRICAIIDVIDPASIAEPCVGMGGIFLRRRVRAPREYINDYSGEVANFWRMVQEHPAALNDILSRRIASRAEFERLRATPPATLTELNRAARFIQLQRLAFGGKVVGQHFGVSAGQSARFSPRRLEPIINAIAARIDGVVIEQLPYGRFIAAYDRPEMLFYIDPPYWGSEDSYGADLFGRADHALLAAQLGGIRGRFILSINDEPGVRECYGEFRMQAVETTWSIMGMRDGGQRRGELIISNFDLPG